MSQNRGYLQRYAMLFGTYMGVFWILKFILLPLSSSIPFFLSLFNGLTMVVPFMAYYYVRMYRNEVCGGQISFGHAWIFTVFMYLFAALLTVMAHYIYFQFFDNGHLLVYFLNIMEEGKKVYPPEWQAFLELLEEGTRTVFTQTPIRIAVHIMSTNVMYGSLLAIPTALFVMRRGKPEKQQEE